jgi:predicted  nucleic acid-binding Zn-ribbon protein
MSDSQAYEEVRISSDGVTVTKRFEEDEFPVPAIAFEFVSDRDESVTVTLSDEVPDSVAVEDLGFHPEYGSEFWTIDEDEISFEREFDANTEYTTVYGIRATGADDVEKFLTEPVIEIVDPPLPDSEKEEEEDEETADYGAGSDDIVPESDDDIVKDVISGEGEVPGLEDEDDATDEEIETLDLKDPNDPDDAGTTVTADSGGGSDAETEEGSDSVDVDTDSVVSAMAEEIRQNNVPVDDLKLVQRAIDKLADRDGASSGDGAHDARVDKLQSDIADLRAYTDALEEFLEEEGTGDQLIRDFESQLDEFDRSLERIQSELSETTDTVSEVRGEMDEVTSEVETVTDEVGSMSEEVDSVSEEIDDVESSVSELESSLEALESSVNELEEEVTDGDVGGRLEDIEEELDDLREWQDQIKSTFGG